VPFDDGTRYRGVVTHWVQGGSGYGFISVQGGTREKPSRDVFVHVTQLVGRDCLRRGDRVTFGLVPHARGPRAVDVELEQREP
jgi:cold shock CspA family protein